MKKSKSFVFLLPCTQTADKGLRGLFLPHKAEGGVISVNIATDDNAVREEKPRKNALMFVCAVIMVAIIITLSACKGQQSIAGLWQDDEKTVMLHLRSDNSATLAIASQSYECTYEVDKDTLVLTIAQDSEDFKNSRITYGYRLSGDRLILIKKDNSETVLHRKYG